MYWSHFIPSFISVWCLGTFFHKHAHHSLNPHNISISVQNPWIHPQHMNTQIMHERQRNWRVRSSTFACTCACRHNGHGFNHPEEAGGCREGEGGRRNKGNKFSQRLPSPMRFPLFQMDDEKLLSQNWGNKNRFQIRVDVRWLILIFWSYQQKYSFSISQTYEIILKLHRLQYLWLPNSCDTISSIAGTNTDCTNSL